jgi:hypothetical protein
MDKSSANSTGCVAPTEKNTVNGVKGVSKTTQQNGNAIIEFVILGR